MHAILKKRLEIRNLIANRLLVTLWGALLLAILFSLQPFFTLIFCLILGSFIKSENQTHIYVLAFLVSLYLGLVNITKTPESDLLNYIQAFHDSQLLGLSDFLVIHSREPLYYISVFILGNSGFISETGFVFMSTFFPYYIFLSAIIKLSASVCLRNRSIIIIMISLAFFPQLFSLSAHLMRQFLAAAIMVYVLSEFIIFGEKKYLVGIVAFLNHFSVGVFFLLQALASFVPRARLSTSLNVAGYLLTLLVSFNLLLLIAKYLTELPLVGMIFVRLIDPSGSDHGPFNILQFIFASVVIGMSIFNMSGRYKILRTSNAGLVHLVIIVFSLLVLISTLESSLSLMSLRFSIFLYFIMGLVAPFTLIKIDKMVRVDMILLGLVPVIIYAFFYKTYFGVFNYADPIELLAFSIFELWNYR